MRNYVDENRESYDKVYEKGWGNRYPDSNLVSYYFNYIKPLQKRDGNRKLKMLDFGCSLGANTKFFEDMYGDEVYGIDISEKAIERCVKYNGFIPSHFKALNLLEEESLEAVFETKFDLIVASNVMYYFRKEDAVRILKKFEGALTDGGVIYANWVTWNNDTYRQFKNYGEQQIKVSNTGSMDEMLDVYVMEGKKEMKELFSMFETRYIKSSMIELEGENELIHYIGIKRCL